MKLVEGTTIEQLFARGLPDAEACRHAAAILVKVAQAVDHAHQRGVLHRDLKPSNILLDQEHEPHVSDFGLARQTGEDSALTATQGLIGTPAYLAPEVAAGGGRQATVAADVYGLGAVLYHLLTGQAPFRKDTIPATLRAVQETEPRVPHLLNPLAPHDLETICLRCLEKEPSKRYATARQLAEELDRFLRDEPILARPLTRAERAWRWCRRKRALAALLLVILVLLLAMAIGSPIAAYRINQARRQAQAGERQARTEAAKSRQVAEFLKKMLQGVDPSVALGRDTSLLRYILDATAEQIDAELKDQPAVEAELLDTIGWTYHTLHESAKAEAMHRRALALRKKLFGDEHPDVARSLDKLALSLYQQGKYAQAEDLNGQALAMRKKLLGNEHPEVATSLNDLALTLLQQGKYAQAEPLLREALAIDKKLLGNDPRALDNVFNSLASTLIFQGKLDEAEQMLRDAVASQKQYYGEDAPGVAALLNNLAKVLSDQGKYAEAETRHHEALAMARKLLGNEHPQIAKMLGNFASTLTRQGKYAEAQAISREALTIQRKRLGDKHPAVAESLNELGVALGRQGSYAAAVELHREALAIRKEGLGKDHPATAVSLNNLADVLYRQSKYAEAEPLYRESLQNRRARLGANHEDVLYTTANLARLLSDWAWAEGAANSESRNPNPEVTDRAREAESLLRDCLGLRLNGTNAPHWRTDDVRSRLGGALLAVAVTDAALTGEARQSRLTEAEGLLLQGYNRLQQTESADRLFKSDALERLVRLYQAWDAAAPNTGKSAQADEWKQKLEALCGKGQ
jgi:Tfp pilus assembly protein PilF